MRPLLPLLALSTATLAACIHGPHIPGDLKGDVPVVIANRGASAICAVTMMPFDQKNPTFENWLGDSFRQSQIGAGKDREFRIKPGAYRLAAVACNQTWAAGTQEGKLVVESPTFVAIGTRFEAPADFKLAFLPAKAVEQQQYASGGGEEAPAEEAPAEEASSSSSSSSGESASTPSGPQCLAHGAVCDGDHTCCSGMSCASRFKYSDGSLGIGSCQ